MAMPPGHRDERKLVRLLAEGDQRSREPLSFSFVAIGRDADGSIPFLMDEHSHGDAFKSSVAVDLGGLAQSGDVPLSPLFDGCSLCISNRLDLVFRCTADVADACE